MPDCMRHMRMINNRALPSRWRPPLDMLKDTLLIPSIEDNVGFSWFMEDFKHLIKSQYEKLKLNRYFMAVFTIIPYIF